MITRIQAAATRVITRTPICNGSKSRAMQHHTKTANSTTTITTTIAGQLQKHMTAHTMDATTTRTRRAATTLRRCSMAALQVLVLVCALPPPLQPLRSTTQRWAGAVEALPITSKPIEGTAENLAWQAWLMLPPEQKQLEKSRKVTPKSIFSLPFRDCPPGHQLFQSRCIPTVNINQSDLLTQQVLGLFGGSVGGATGADNAYEIDYGDEEYDLGLGEGEPVMMYEAPQPFNGGLVVGASNTQQPPARDEPLKFNLFEQKFPTNDYEADMSSGAMEGSGSARPLTELLAANGSEGERVGVADNDNDAGATFFNSTQFLDAVQGFFQRNVVASQNESNATTTAVAGSNANITDHNTRAVNGSQVLADLSADGSNVPAFADGDIDAIILPAVGAGTTVKTFSGYAGDLEPQRISLFKDDSSVHLVTTVIAQPAKDERAGGEDADAGDLVAAAQQQEHSIAQFLRADALLPLSSVAPYITTTSTTTATTPNTHDAGHAPKTSSMRAKDEHPRSVTPHKASTAANNTDAQETSFITTTEPEGTTNFQIDETTVIEAQDADALAAESNLSLLQAISQQQQIELGKSKATAVEDVPSTTLVTGVVHDKTEVAGDNTTTQTATIIYETSETTTTVQNAAEESADTADTTTQPLPSAATVSSATTTPQAASASTLSTYRFRNTPTVATAAITPIQIPARGSAAYEQVPILVTTVVPQTVEMLSGEEATTRVSAGSAIMSDVPSSGSDTDGDLVNVVAASSNSDTDNDSNKYKNAPARSEPAEAASVTRDVNIAQELRMINELVKGNRQATATKMAATKTTETAAATIQSTTISMLATANAPDSEVQQSASAAESDQQASASGAEAVEVRQDVDGATTTTTETATQVPDTSTLNKSSLPADSGSAIIATTTATTQSLSLTKMESANQRAESSTADNAQLSETSSKKRVEVEIHTSAKPDFETEATATDTEFMAATTLWSRIMPIFGFGGSAVDAEADAPATTTTTTTTAVAESTPIGSISSNSSSISSSSSKSKNSLSVKSSSMEKNNNNNNIINNSKSDFDTPSRRNSKIIRIDHFSDNSVAAATAATTTNTLEDTAATITKTTDDFVIVPEEHEPIEQSAYWWLPANWRLNRDTTEEQPLLFRLWSAFPESQMKTKVRT
nr:protein folded gastrulation [Bactrocera oleae]XP_036222078.1 protein folded gastrulation [Bactrocera oleae]